MANFCTKCGRKLQDGEVCSCQQNRNQQRINQEWSNSQQMNQQFGNPQQGMGQQYSGPNFYYSKNIFQQIMKLIKQPITEGKQFINDADMITAFVLIALQGVFNAFFAMLAGKDIAKFISSLVGLVDYSTSKTVSDLLDIPYFRIFIVTVLFTIISACVLAGLMFAGYKIMGEFTTFSEMISASAVRSTILIPAIILSIIIFEMSWSWGIGCFLIINIFGFVCFIIVNYSIDGNKKTDLFVIITGIVLILFIVFIYFSISKIWTFYLPDVIKTAVEKLNDLSFTDILNESFN